jgi:hypothetical protein
MGQGINADEVLNLQNQGLMLEVSYLLQRSSPYPAF